MRFSIDFSEAFLVLLLKSFPIWAAIPLLISLCRLPLARYENLSSTLVSVLRG
jgi:hypothetical protein